MVNAQGRPATAFSQSLIAPQAPRNRHQRSAVRALFVLVSIAVAFALLPSATPTARAQKSWAHEHWITTWSASMQVPFSIPGRPPVAQGFDNQTVRMIVHTSVGAHRARVRISNEYGKDPLVIGAAHIALRAQGGAIIPASDHALTFSGKPSFTIPAGAMVISDPVDIDVPELGDLAISVFVPGKIDAPTQHGTGLHPTYVAGPGDFTGKTEITDAAKQESWYWLSGVDVTAPKDAAVIVAFGDSITDGARSTVDTNAAWPSELARRILASHSSHHEWAVVDAGISGNRVLHDLIGDNALRRFDTDVVAQPGVKCMIVLEGINDIGFPNSPFGGGQAVSADDLIAGLRQLVERAHVHGIATLGGTLTPFEGATYFSADGEAKREAINNWVRTSGAFDGVVDFEAAVRDPQQPTKMLAAYDSGDHLHPNDAGYKAMGDAVDLALFAKAKK
jgi:lysophospholipase L1-like esterase